MIVNVSQDNLGQGYELPVLFMWMGFQVGASFCWTFSSLPYTIYTSCSGTTLSCTTVSISPQHEGNNLNPGLQSVSLMLKLVFIALRACRQSNYIHFIISSDGIL